MPTTYLIYVLSFTYSFGGRRWLAFCLVNKYLRTNILVQANLIIGDLNKT